MLYCAAVSFTRLAMKKRFNRSDLDSLDTLSEQILDLFTQICKDKSLKLPVTYKIHKLLHYANNVRKFGPLYLGSTLRYERCHQISKKYGRIMGSWKSPAVTLSERMALRQALSLSDSGPSISGTKEEWTRQVEISEEEAITMGLIKAPSDKCPFTLEVNVVRPLTADCDVKQWLEAKKFLINPETDQIFAQGLVWKIDLNDQRPAAISTLKRVIPSRETIYNIEWIFEDNDFLFKPNAAETFINEFV